MRMNRKVFVQFSNKRGEIRRAVRKIKALGDGVLVVPSQDMEKAISLFAELGASGGIRNLVGTEKREVKQ